MSYSNNPKNSPGYKSQSGDTPQDSSSTKQHSTKSHDPSMSEAARIMRTSSNPEERSAAAREMGRRGGERSHGGGRPSGSSNKNKS
ncbi:MAG: hypothetical protein ACK4M7_03050 [Burkholderiales bacterium]|jgi:hypothetical protein